MSNTLTVELPVGVDSDEARLLLSLKLFEADKITLGYAARMAGCTKVEFMRVLARHGIPAFSYTVEEFEEELEGLDQLQADMTTEPPPRPRTERRGWRLLLRMPRC